MLCLEQWTALPSFLPLWPKLTFFFLSRFLGPFVGKEPHVLWVLTMCHVLCAHTVLLKSHRHTIKLSASSAIKRINNSLLHDTIMAITTLNCTKYLFICLCVLWDYEILTQSLCLIQECVLSTQLMLGTLGIFSNNVGIFWSSFYRFDIWGLPKVTKWKMIRLVIWLKSTRLYSLCACC